MGEGGAVFTNNAKLMTIAESFRDWGRDCYCDPGCDNTCEKRLNKAVWLNYQQTIVLFQFYGCLNVE
jgi:dTDP-4-amino-4,6-dideoxygalactose transaminase